MVVHEGRVSPLEIPVVSKPVLNRKTYDNVKNLVKELSKTSRHRMKRSTSENNSPPNIESRSKIRKTMSQKTNTKHEESSSSTTECEEDTQHKSIQIDEIDLKDLKSVYLKCKEVMNKIESKYGHLLDLNADSNKINTKRKAVSEDFDAYDECQCVVNTKIIFDDDGKQQSVNTIAERHICPKKLKKSCNTPEAEINNIAIEYNEIEIQLPDDVQELGSILKDTNIETTYRNKVIEKIKSLKQDYANEIKFNRHSLIEKMKSNSEVLLDFKGSNLSSLPGYIVQNSEI